MDPDYSAQDVATCDLRKTTIAHNYCDFCHVNLCKPPYLWWIWQTQNSSYSQKKIYLDLFKMIEKG